MNYPLNELTIITPIIFFVLLAAFPVIGVFAGWKRAAYWGGGNFLFYITGLVVWKLAGGAIANAIAPLLQSLLGDKAKGADLSQLINSIVVPAYYIIFMILANIILVICYYAFAKRLLRIGKYKDWQPKKKQNETTTAKVKQVRANVNTKNGSIADKKWFNMVVGGVGLTALMLPITLTTTHAVALTTTSTSTRKTNSLTSGLYNGLQGVAGNMSWFSYYNGQNTGKDYDALFSMLGLSSKTIQYKDLNDNIVSDNPINALSNTVSNGMTNVINSTKDLKNLDTKESAKGVAESINKLSASWDSIMSQCGDDVNVVFNSTGVTEVIKTMLGDTKDPISITNESIQDQMKEGSVYSKIVDAYSNPKTDPEGNKYYAITTGEGEVPITPTSNKVVTSKEAFDDIVDSVYSMYDISQLTDENKNLLREQTSQQIQMLITYQ